MEENQGLEQAVTSRDVYVYVTETSGVVATKECPRGYRFFAGTEPLSQGWLWSAIGILELAETESLYDLPPAADRALDGPADPVDDTEKPVKYGTRVLRRTKHFPFFGFARLKAGIGKANQVLDAINDEIEGYNGSALVTGGKYGFHLLVEMGGATRDEVRQRLEALLDVEGVSTAEFGIVAGVEYCYEGQKRTLGETQETST